MNRFPFYIPIIFIVIIVLLLISFIVIAKSNNKVIDKDKMYFRNHFSYEYFYARSPSTFYLRIVLISITVFSVVSSCLFVACFKIDHLSTFVFAIFIGMIFIFAIINSFLTFTIRPNYLTMFKIYVTLLFLLNALASGILGIILMNSMFENALYKVFGGLSFLNLLINIILMINPKLKDWDKLEENINANNEKIYVRPRIMCLPISMWISYLTLIISVIYLLLSITFIGAGI